MLEGFDISNNNELPLINSYIAVNRPAFCFMKASEGCSYRDRKLDENYGVIKENGIVPGFYHFAKWNSNTGRGEAENFLKCISPYMEDGALLCLDVEGKALRAPNAWIREFIDRVEEEYTGRVIIYIQRSAIPGKIRCFQDNGLWVASWGDNLLPPHTIAGYQIAFWQDGLQNGLDHDIFNGNMEQLLKYKCYRKGAK